MVDRTVLCFQPCYVGMCFVVFHHSVFIVGVVCFQWLEGTVGFAFTPKCRSINPVLAGFEMCLCLSASFVCIDRYIAVAL